VLDSYTQYDGPLIVLTSRASASAAEIVAQALQDYGRALIVGDPETYGKGTIQHQTVTDRSATVYFKVTVGRYYTVSGKSTQITGVKSDLVVPSPWFHEQIGERYLEYPLPSDQVSSAYYDTLSDIPPHQRPWFFQYYLPRLQQKNSQLNSILPILTTRSQSRLQSNQTYQLFLRGEEANQGEQIATEEFDLLIEEAQHSEAVQIMEDVITLLSKSTSPGQKFSEHQQKAWLK
jgi:carboxyl-terminal processing protease